MGGFVDLTGQKFGRLTVTGRAKTRLTKSGNRITSWECVCECGKAKTVRGCALKSGATKSCGCYSAEVKSQRMKEITKRTAEICGGHSREELYRIWNAMKQRCYNKKQKGYKHYGERGVTVCDEWLNDYVSFKKWAMGNGYQRGLTIDRIDSYGPYAPWNCRWATQKEQQNNKRFNIIIEMRGETHTLSEWVDMFGINYRRAWRIYKRGFRGEELYKLLESEKKVVKG